MVPHEYFLEGPHFFYPPAIYPSPIMQRLLVIGGDRSAGWDKNIEISKYVCNSSNDDWRKQLQNEEIS